MAAVCLSTALRTSAATTMDRATAVQISHCRTSSLTVFITVWKMPSAVDSTSRTKDPLVVMTNVLSENVSRENAESRSSFDSIEKNKRNSANVTMPMVRAMPSPCTCSAQLITPALIVLAGTFARLPAGASRVYGRLLNAATGLFDWVNYLGSYAGARAVPRRRLAGQLDRVTLALERPR